ncbi:unnamed protein product [marine sediment metagenome]|uniref:Uncharacterized protein n=1 Tax=marine sediment metagenome TaxID=412755 RepID=X0W7W6_9ZZZZ
MADETTETSEVEEPKAEQSGPKGLRDKLAQVEAENARLRAGAMTSAFKDIGLDPEMGLGKAIAKEYKGETSLEALTAYAKDEYGHVAPADPTHPQAQTIVQEQQRLDQAAVGSGSVVAPSQSDELATAEAEGNWQKAMTLKGNEVARMMQANK